MFICPYGNPNGKKSKHQCGVNFFLVLVVEYSRYMDLNFSQYSAKT